MKILEKKLINEIIPAAIYLGGWKITPETKIKDLLVGSSSYLYLNEFFLTEEIQKKFNKTPKLNKVKTIRDLADWLKSPEKKIYKNTRTE
jgi:hypothetical protein